MQNSTASQLPAGTSTFQPNPAEIEYGCVDWFSYASVDDERSEFVELHEFEHRDSVLAGGIT